MSPLVQKLTLGVIALPSPKHSKHFAKSNNLKQIHHNLDKCHVSKL